MITMLLALLNILFTKVESTPSVMQCPININLIGAGQGFPFGGALTPGGEYCGSGSFLHFYTCCDDNPFRCCFEFETWAIVVFSVLLVLLIGGILFGVGRYACNRY
ncbi:hypothetical protein Tcan_04850 [Toxocara canis]|uniref:Uncharacterized protein n=1 Tax=Toxocara canis TaxID=6265 RepID=A0A0B2VEH0_TOXCA|nr:hypothetical protein Tcan_04850 [Toxocara canis]